jgi:hypothetical protein
MPHHVRPPQQFWGYDGPDDWPDDCPPPSYGRVRFTIPPPAHPRVVIDLPPCTPRAGINTDWSGNKCAPLHDDSSYALLPAPPAHPQVWQPAPPAQPEASQPAPPAQSQAPAPSADLPPCTPHAGINTDWSSNNCALLHDSSSDAGLPAAPAQPQMSQPAPPARSQAPAPAAQPQVSQPAPPTQSPAPAPAAQPQASQPASPAQSPAPAPSAQPQASQPAPPVQSQAPAPSAQPKASQPAPPAPPKPSADPVTVGQAAHDHADQASVMSSLGFDVAIALGLALAFVVVRRFVLDMIEPSRPPLRAGRRG